MSSKKGQEKNLETNLNEMKISDLPDKEFKTMVIKMLSEIRTTHEQSENFNKEVENIIKYQTKTIEMKNLITELKNSVEGFNIRLYQVEERQ